MWNLFSLSDHYEYYGQPIWGQCMELRSIEVDKVGRSYRLPNSRITLLYWFQMSQKLPAKSKMVAKENTFHVSIKRNKYM